MHELSIALALVEQMEKTAREHHACSVPSVTVMVGAMSGVDPEALRGAFPLAAEGTAAEGADLRITEVEAAVRCRSCGAESKPDLPFLRCGACGSEAVDVAAGRELYIQSMDVAVVESGGAE